MAELRTFVCDGCGKQKGETNHWWRVFSNTSLLVVTMWDIDTNVTPDPDDPPMKEQHFCSESCVSKRLSEFMGGK